MGMATKTPSAAIAANQATSSAASGRAPVSITSAGSAAMLPPPVMYPADEATEAMALFSSGPNSVRTRRTALAPRKNANARMQAVTVTPRLQPVLRTM